MLVSQLVESVRDQLLERNIDPITNRLIVNRLNDAYRFVYNAYAKSNDNMFGRDLYLQVNARQSEYVLPKDLWNKRVETFEVPNPSNSNASPQNVYSYLKVEKSDRRQLAYYDTPAIATPLPSKWAQYDNRIRITPPPSNSYRARLFHIPALVPLAMPQGRVLDFAGNRISLDDATSADLAAALAGVDSAFVSVSDFQTGRLKATYKFNEIDGRDIVLAPSTRTLYQGYPVLSVKASSFGQVTKAGTLLSAVVGEHSFVVGDYFEIDYTVDDTLSYRIQDTDLSSALYHPAEIVALPANSFSRGGVVSAATATTISWVDPTFVPLYTAGYRTGQTPANTTVLSATATGFSTSDIITVTLATNIAGVVAAGGAWNVKVGDRIRVSLSGTGGFPVAMNTATYVTATVTAANTIQVGIQPQTTGNTGFVGTCDLAPLSSGLTGTPQLLADATGTTPVDIASLYANTPYAMSQRPTNLNDPDAYDPANIIALDDIVTIGVSTGCSILSEALSEFLWQRSLLAIRGSLNENDPEINKQIKDLEAALMGDTAGRPLGRKIERTFGLLNNYRRPTRS